MRMDRDIRMYWNRIQLWQTYCLTAKLLERMLLHEYIDLIEDGSLNTAHKNIATHA